MLVQRQCTCVFVRACVCLYVFVRTSRLVPTPDKRNEKRKNERRANANAYNAFWSITWEYLVRWQRARVSWTKTNELWKRLENDGLVFQCMNPLAKRGKNKQRKKRNRNESRRHEDEVRFGCIFVSCYLARTQYEQRNAMKFVCDVLDGFLYFCFFTIFIYLLIHFFWFYSLKYYWTVSNGYFWQTCEHYNTKNKYMSYLHE